MGVVTIAEAWPTTRRAFTADDLDRTPDDGRRYELVDLKKATYERFGIESYWIVVPDADKPKLIVFELRDGSYELAHVTGDEPFRAERPFTVEVVPSRLVVGLLPE